MTRAERIYNIFKVLHSTTNQSLMDRWKKVFDTNEIFEVYFYLEKLYREIEILENELDIPSQIYTPILNKCKSLTKNYQFNINLSNIKMNETQLATFYGFSFYGVDEKVINFEIDDDLEKLLNSLHTIKNKELKFILNDIYSTIHKLKTLPKITSLDDLQSTFSELICKTQINIDEINKAPKEFKTTLISIYTKIDKNLSFLEKWIGRVDTITKLIGGQ